MVRSFSTKLRVRSLYDPHKFTFLHPGGVISYAVLRPPSNTEKSSLTTSQENLPVLINLHGAGLEADNAQLVHSLDDISALSCWTLFPTGGSPWSGDDWHIWGWEDVESAVGAIPAWIESVQWTGTGVDTSRWLVVGHSNGGQGVWRALTHKPDNIIAAAPISGYLSIQKYVPYNFWREAEPRRTAVIQSSLSSYRHELLISNAKGIPIFQQHGGADDNVPPYHSRRMYELLCQSGSISDYNEVQGKGHWWDGVLTTDRLQRFYRSQLHNSSSNTLVHPSQREFASDFEIVTANPGESGPKFGIRIMQLLDPGQLGRVKASIKETAMHLRTSNLLTLSLPSKMFSLFSVILDKQNVTLFGMSGDAVTLRNVDGNWRTCPPAAPCITERVGMQLGRMDAILKTRGLFSIMHSTNETTKALAVQISRNLYQYFGADADILQTTQTRRSSSGNLITVGIGSDVPAGSFNDHPIQLMGSGVSIRNHLGKVRRYMADEFGLAAVLLRPMPHEKLELVVWGVDNASVAIAARLVPLLAGVGQPDFIILTKECSWAGIEGVVAMGFFDSQWNITPSSFLS